MDLKSLIETHLDLPRLAKDLDELGPPGRLWAVRQWTRSNLAVLWDAARGFRAVTLDDFVPGSAEPRLEVIHEGKNSLPIFGHFQKRFCKPSPPQDEPVLVGFNKQPLAAVTGPGYFTVRQAPDAGEVHIDYTTLPRDRAPGWPPLESNTTRLGPLVYAGVIDVMRGLSSHVVIGRAKKAGAMIDNWFALVRQDADSTAEGRAGLVS